MKTPYLLKSLLSIIFLLMILNPYKALSQCDFKISKVSENNYKVKVDNYDVVAKEVSETACFAWWLDNGKDKPDGTLSVYDENGKKRVEAHFDNEKPVGKRLEYFSTGQLETEVTFISSSHRILKQYYKSGQLHHSSEYGNPKGNDLSKSYYENGQIKTIDDGTGFGHKVWHENGNLKSERDAASSIYNEWYSNGKLKITGGLQSGYSRIGTWKYFDVSGKLTRELKYQVSDNGLSENSFYESENGYYEEKKY